MKLTCTKDSRWQRKDGSILTVVKGQDLEVGKDISDAIAEDMLRCDYAIAKGGMPRVETKKEVIEVPKKKDDKSFNIETANADELEAFARKELGLELDKRIKINKLRKQVKGAINKKPHGWLAGLFKGEE